MEPRNGSTLNQSPLVGTRLEGPKQLHLERQQTSVDAFSLADDTRSSKQGDISRFKKISG